MASEKKSGCWAICIGVFMGAAAILIGGFLWLHFFPSPNIVVTPSGDGLMIRNYFIEYWIGLSEVRIEDTENGQVVLWARAKSERYPNFFEVYSGIQQPTEYQTNLWDYVEVQREQIHLEPGRVYKAHAWGNNGFGRFNRSTIDILIPKLHGNQGTDNLEETRSPDPSEELRGEEHRE